MSLEESAWSILHGSNLAECCQGDLNITLFYSLSKELFTPYEWSASNFFQQYHPWIKHQGHENKGNDPKFKKLLIFWQILL